MKALCWHGKQPEVSERAFRQAWRVRRPIDRLYADGLISFREWKVACLIATCMRRRSDRCSGQAASTAPDPALGAVTATAPPSGSWPRSSGCAGSSSTVRRGCLSSWSLSTICAGATSQSKSVGTLRRQTQGGPGGQRDEPPGGIIDAVWAGRQQTVILVYDRAVVAHSLRDADAGFFLYRDRTRERTAGVSRQLARTYRGSPGLLGSNQTGSTRTAISPTCRRHSAERTTTGPLRADEITKER
jgi:hypothetical protein